MSDPLVERRKGMLEFVERLAIMETTTAEIRTDVGKVCKALDGNGAPGLVVRVDRLEQGAEAQRWTLRAVVVVLLGVVGKMISGVLTVLLK